MNGDIKWLKNKYTVMRIIMRILCKEKMWEFTHQWQDL